LAAGVPGWECVGIGLGVVPIVVAVEGHAANDSLSGSAGDSEAVFRGACVSVASVGFEAEEGPLLGVKHVSIGADGVDEVTECAPGEADLEGDRPLTPKDLKPWGWEECDPDDGEFLRIA
jgi:hypothetical protein